MAVGWDAGPEHTVTFPRPGGFIWLSLRPEQVAIDEIRYWTVEHLRNGITKRGHGSLTEAIAWCRRIDAVEYR